MQHRISVSSIKSIASEKRYASKQVAQVLYLCSVRVMIAVNGVFRVTVRLGGNAKWHGQCRTGGPQGPFQRRLLKHIKFSDSRTKDCARY
jgi:hypothetical protein